ncbi:MAG: hypothetical protein QOH76_3507 [Thermoleophilaceae bacterium]|nr:hypothetical protein [Thermoleophilaceae bacterium]
MPSPGRGRGQRAAAHPAVRTARRAWPLLVEAYRRWDRLTPEQKERYRRMASEYSQRGRDALGRRRPKR